MEKGLKEKLLEKSPRIILAEKEEIPEG